MYSRSDVGKPSARCAETRREQKYLTDLSNGFLIDFLTIAHDHTQDLQARFFIASLDKLLNTSMTCSLQPLLWYRSR